MSGDDCTQSRVYEYISSNGPCQRLKLLPLRTFFTWERRCLRTSLQRSPPNRARVWRALAINNTFNRRKLLELCPTWPVTPPALRPFADPRFVITRPLVSRGNPGFPLSQRPRRIRAAFSFHRCQTLVVSAPFYACLQVRKSSFNILWYEPTAYHRLPGSTNSACP